MLTGSTWCCMHVPAAFSGNDILALNTTRPLSREPPLRCVRLVLWACCPGCRVATLSGCFPGVDGRICVLVARRENLCSAARVSRTELCQFVLALRDPPRPGPVPSSEATAPSENVGAPGGGGWVTNALMHRPLAGTHSEQKRYQMKGGRFLSGWERSQGYFL